jgi:hypothetical protein
VSRVKERAKVPYRIEHRSICDDGCRYRSFEQTYRDHMTIGSDSQGRSWTGLDDGRGGTLWTIKPVPLD